MTNAIHYTALGYPMAAQDGTGRWIVYPPDSSLTGLWGTFRIEAGATWDATGTVAVKTVAGTDITTIGSASAPTLIEALTFGEPYGELTGSLVLAGANPFDSYPAPGVYPGANIDIWRVLPASEAASAGTAEVPYWHGIIASLEIADGDGITTSVTAQLTGALYGEASVRQHQPLMLDTASDVGTWCGRALDYALYSRPFSPFTRFTFESTTTSIDVRYRGSRGQSTIDYLDELLSLAQDDTGTWTISRAFQTLGGISYPRARHYYLRQKAAYLGDGVQQNTVFMGGYGIALSVSQDFTESPNVIYGEGVHPVDNSYLSGSRWRNAVYPMLNGTVPTYPSRLSGSTYPITVGDTDGAFTTPVITQLTAQLRLGGWPGATIGTVLTTADTDAIVAWKQDVHYSNSNANIGGTAEWAALFASGSGATDLSSGWFKPLAVGASAVDKYLYTAAGDVAGTNPSYDASILRVESIITYGENVPKSRARKNARRLVSSDYAQLVGTITLMSDPTDENGAARSRFDIREGGWIQVNNLPGGASTSFYIAGVTHAPEQATTTLTVSDKAYDLLDLSTRIERNRNARTDPAKSFYSQRLAAVRPFRSAVGWDAESGAGQVPSFAAAGSAWTVQRFVASQFGQIGSLRVDTSPDAAYCFAVFGGSVSASWLNSLVSAPLGSVTGNYSSWWQHPDKLTALGTAGFIEAWGSFGEPAGYYPGAFSAAGTPASTITGALEDAGSWSFASLEPPWLWCAIWPSTSGTVTVDAQMKIIVDEG